MLDAPVSYYLLRLSDDPQQLQQRRVGGKKKSGDSGELGGRVKRRQFLSESKGNDVTSGAEVKGRERYVANVSHRSEMEPD